MNVWRRLTKGKAVVVAALVLTVLYLILRPPLWCYTNFALGLHWQEEANLQIYDQNTVHSGKLLIRNSAGSLEPSYEILIDDRQNTIYLYAMPWH